MHSIINASGLYLEKYLTNLICSPIDALLSLCSSTSLPTSLMILGIVPVVFAKVLSPPSLRPAAINRVTLDFPLVPLTWILIGIFFKEILWIYNSIYPIIIKNISREDKDDIVIISNVSILSLCYVFKIN